MNADEHLIECSTSPDAAHEYWKALEEDDMMFSMSPESTRRTVADKTTKFCPIKVESADSAHIHNQPVVGGFSAQHHPIPMEGNPVWADQTFNPQMNSDRNATMLGFDPSIFPSDFLNFVPTQIPSYDLQNSYVQQPMGHSSFEEHPHKMRIGGAQPTRIITPAVTVPRTKSRKRRKKSSEGELEGRQENERMGVSEGQVGSSKEVESLLKQLGNGGEVTLHVYENAQRLYIRYINENGMWQMRDVADFVNVKFHTDSDSSMPVPPAVETSMPSCQSVEGEASELALIPSQQQQHSNQQVCISNNLGPSSTTLGCMGTSLPLESAYPPYGMMADPMTGGYPGLPAPGPCMVMPAVKELSRDLVLEFKRKEHYWRRGIWVRVVVDVVAKGGNGTPVREAGGSINVALLSVKGKVIKKACEKCSKYYFRYKNIESTGQAPAFEIEERERCTAVRGGRASFNMRVWECSHHYLSPHTLLFSWVDPCNPCMRTVALCPKEIVISSGSGQEKKLKEMTVSREEVFRDFADALILMESAQYCRAVEALRCIRWKCFHFLGIGLPSIVDEKIGDCFLRMGDYRGAIEHFARASGHLNKAKDRMEPGVYFLMRALLYLKLANAAYSRERDSVQVMNLKKSSKTLKKSRAAFQQALEWESQLGALIDSVNDGGEGSSRQQQDSTLLSFVKKYLQFSYYQTMTGLFLKMKPFQLAMGDLAGSITYEAIAHSMEEAERTLGILQTEEKAWFSTDMLSVFGPLVEKLHTGVDSLKKLLHSPFATNKVITQFSLMNEQSPPMSPEQLGEKVLLVLRELKQAADEAEELHPKGHRTICICKCLLALFMYLGGQLTREEALRSVEEILRQIEKFWKTNGGVSGGRFECQQVASIAEYIRSNQRNMGNPFAVFDDREHMQLYRMFIHSPLDIAVWALQAQVNWS